ncbi:cytochrome c [Pseudomonas aeruginosa]|jgi:cytochrome c55X|uniref:cytochrome c55X n=1 Tax=Pseudomonas TaxID=286 RepID=UPI000465AF20|nr:MULTISPECIES: cytochrome c55X [Pseudomonas]EIU1681585.1 cytochrome c55X [Pseudomonas aeruginosa]EKX0639196.1 cytochrome c55X [Pseudomonas aeruginosa]ELH7264340.1 cytochrome c55X [Pseudomonas aeruginosa]ELL1155916.1 cytochrome c55X [Pseudomonas aeruginosa]KAA5565014.1 cytochrome c55X [Pseudomonas aeruginosa]
MNAPPDFRRATSHALWLALALTFACPLPGLADEHPDARRQAQLRHLLLQDCGSCHGLRLTGGLGPALTPEALRGKPRESLVATVLMGRPQTPMPPWAGLLSEDDAGWLVDRLIEGEIAP